MVRGTRFALAILLLSGFTAGAQIIFPGSTLQGDYLRGLGFAEIGLGVLEVDDAVARSINTDTAMRWNDYLVAATRDQTRNYVMRRQHQIDEDRENYKKDRARIRNTPEARDVRVGSALNEKLRELLDPAIPESSFRYKPLVISGDVIRRIPFKIEGDLVFSMHRLTATGKHKWPPALQDPKFAREREAYERAVDAVIDQQIEGKMTIAAMKAVEIAVDGLLNRLDQVLPPSRATEYLQAKNRLIDFKKTATRLIPSHKMQIVIGKMEKYSGRNVHDLIVFMRDNSLEFASAETPEERSLFPELYTDLVLQLEIVRAAEKTPAK